MSEETELALQKDFSKKNVQSMLDTFSNDVEIIWRSVKWVDHLIARSYIDIVERWLKWELSKSDSILLKALDQMSDLMDYTTKEKTINHEFNMPRLKI